MGVNGQRAPRTGPLLLAAPSRFAAFGRTQARAALALFAALLLATWLSLAMTPAGDAAADPTDIVVSKTVVAGLRGGGDYYAVAADALRQGDHPMSPFTAFRLPTLAVVQAALPSIALLGLIYALAAGVLLAWYERLRGVFATARAHGVAGALLVCGIIALGGDDAAGSHELWAGLLVALSLALRRPDRWIEPIAIALVAMLSSESAALYVAIMALFALAEGHRREAIGWGVGLLVFALVLALHAYGVAQVVRPTDTGAAAWTWPMGIFSAMAMIAQATILGLVPAWLAAPLAVFALLGWGAWNDPLARRALGLFMSYALLLGLFARPDSPYWGLMIAPPLLLGLAFAPDALRDLVSAARTRRKITITRLVR